MGKLFYRIQLSTCSQRKRLRRRNLKITCDNFIWKIAVLSSAQGFTNKIISTSVFKTFADIYLQDIKEIFIPKQIKI